MKTVNSVGNNMISITLGKPEGFTAEFKALFELSLLLQDWFFCFSSPSLKLAKEKADNIDTCSLQQTGTVDLTSEICGF